MNLAQAQQIMLSTFATAWGTTSPIVYPNGSAPEPDVDFVRVQMTFIEERQATLGAPGSRRFERRENLVARLYHFRDTGLTAANNQIHLLRTTFDGFVSGELWVVKLTPKYLGTNGRCRMTDVAVEYRYHEIK